MIIGLGQAQVVLGMPWLTKHNPHIDWEKKTISLEGEHICKTTLSTELAIAAQKDEVILPLQYCYGTMETLSIFLVMWHHAHDIHANPA